MLPKTYIANYGRAQATVNRLPPAPSEDAEQWVTGRIRQAADRLMTVEETVTPSRARALLDRNPSNRSVSKMKVKKIARDISGGRWRLNGETIIVAKDGSLNDGQHRMMAIIDAGSAIVSNIAWGAERDSRFTVDAGSRDADDYLTMNGYSNGSIMGAVARLDLVFLSGLYWDCNAVLTATEITAHAEFINDETQRAIKFCKRKSARDIGQQSSIIFGFMLVCRKAGWHRAEPFFDSFLDGAGSAWWVDSPAFTLRKRFLSDRANSVRISHAEKIELVLRAWNFHAQGKRKLRAIQTLNKFPAIEV